MSPLVARSTRSPGAHSLSTVTAVHPAANERSTSSSSQSATIFSPSPLIGPSGFGDRNRTPIPIRMAARAIILPSWPPPSIPNRGNERSSSSVSDDGIAFRILARIQPIRQIVKRMNENFACLGSDEGPDDAGLLQLVDDACRPRVSDRELALQEGDRALLRHDNDPGSLLEQIVRVFDAHDIVGAFPLGCRG